MTDLIKKAFSVCFLLVMVLAGCGGGSGGNSTQNSKDFIPTNLQLNEVASAAYESDRLLNTPTPDFRVTGFYAPANAQLKLNVEGVPAANSKLVLLVGTYSRYNNGGRDPTSYSLKPGSNTLTVGNFG